MNLRKRVYTPGIISLIGLTFLFPYCLNKIIPEKLYGLKIITPNDHVTENSALLKYSVAYVEKKIKSKRKLKFLIDENREENNKKMKIIQYEALKLKYTNDTSMVILITLSENSRYVDLINLINLCKYDKHRIYTFWGNKFAIFGDNPTIKKIPSGSVCLLCDDVITVEKPGPKLTLLKRMFNKIGQLYTFQGLSIFLNWLVLFSSFIYFARRAKYSVKSPSSTP